MSSYSLINQMHSINLVTINLIRGHGVGLWEKETKRHRAVPLFTECLCSRHYIYEMLRIFGVSDAAFCPREAHDHTKDTDQVKALHLLGKTDHTP